MLTFFKHLLTEQKLCEKLWNINNILSIILSLNWQDKTLVPSISFDYNNFDFSYLIYAKSIKFELILRNIIRNNFMMIEKKRLLAIIDNLSKRKAKDALSPSV